MPGLTDALQQLESFWREGNAPIANLLQPGLSDSEIDDLTSGHGLRLPEEARTWWRWHDGVMRDVPDAQAQIGPAIRFPSLTEALAYRTRERQALASTSPTNWEELWPAEWLPVAYGLAPPTVVCDCSTEYSETTPIRVLYWDDEEMFEPKAQSMLEMVELWNRAWAMGLYAYDATEQRWTYQEAPVEMDLTRLV
jgi:cell wall assembly regulator SMI1